MRIRFKNTLLFLENVFNVHMGQGRSLRYTALKVVESTSLCPADDIIRTIEEVLTVTR